MVAEILDLSTLIRQGESAQEQGDSDTAYQFFARATELDAQAARAWQGRAATAIDPDEALISLGYAAALRPDDPELPSQLELYVTHRASVAGRPDAPTLVYDARKLAEVGLTSRAEYLFRRAIELDDTCADAYVGLAAVCPDPAESESMLKRATQLAPSHPFVRAELARRQELKRATLATEPVPAAKAEAPSIPEGGAAAVEAAVPSAAEPEQAAAVAEPTAIASVERAPVVSDEEMMPDWLREPHLLRQSELPPEIEAAPQATAPAEEAASLEPEPAPVPPEPVAVTETDQAASAGAVAPAEPLAAAAAVAEIQAAESEQAAAPEAVPEDREGPAPAVDAKAQDVPVSELPAWLASRQEQQAAPLEPVVEQAAPAVEAEGPRAPEGLAPSEAQAEPASVAPLEGALPSTSEEKLAPRLATEEEMLPDWLRAEAGPYTAEPAPAGEKVSAPDTETAAALLAGLLAEGQAALGSGNFEGAYAKFSAATELAPNSEAAWLGRLKAAEDISEKINCLDHVLQINPDNGEALDALNLYRGEKPRAQTTQGIEMTQPGTVPVQAGPAEQEAEIVFDEPARQESALPRPNPDVPLKLPVEPTRGANVMPIVTVGLVLMILILLALVAMYYFHL